MFGNLPDLAAKVSSQTTFPELEASNAHFAPFTEVDAASGKSLQYQSIAFLPEYRAYSFEELRLREDTSRRPLPSNLASLNLAHTDSFITWVGKGRTPVVSPPLGFPVPKFTSWADAVPYSSGWNVVTETNSVFTSTEKHKSAWETSGPGFQTTIEKAWNAAFAGRGFATFTGSGWASVIPHSLGFAANTNAPRVQASSGWTDPRLALAPYPEPPLSQPQNMPNEPEQLQPFTSIRSPTLARRTLYNPVYLVPDNIPTFPPTWPEANHMKGGTANAPFKAQVQTEPGAPERSFEYQAITSMPEYRPWSFEELRVVDYHQGRKNSSTSTGGTACTGDGNVSSPVTKPTSFLHPKFYSGDEHVQLITTKGLFGSRTTDRVFRVHRAVLANLSESMRQLVERSIESADQSVVLAGVGAKDLERFLEIVYCPCYIDPSTILRGKDEWTSVHSLASRWNCADLMRLAMRELDRVSHTGSSS